MKLLVVDGTNLMFQMFYGIPQKIRNRGGKEIHGVVGFIGGFMKCVKKLDPTHVIIIFDWKEYGFRNDIYEGYKRNRKNNSRNKETTSPYRQMSGILMVLEKMNVPYQLANGMEADDLIASYALHFKKELEILIVSSDKDFLQLVDENITMYSYHQKKLIQYNEEKIQEEYHLQPKQLIDLFALEGDSSDNIRGIPRMDHKTAIELIQEYGTMDNMLHHFERLAEKPLHRVIVNEKYKLKMNYKLIQLSNCIEITATLEALAFSSDNLPSLDEILVKAKIY